VLHSLSTKLSKCGGGIFSSKIAWSVLRFQYRQKETFKWMERLWSAIFFLCSAKQLVSVRAGNRVTWQVSVLQCNPRYTVPCIVAAGSDRSRSLSTLGSGNPISSLTDDCTLRLLIRPDQHENAARQQRCSELDSCGLVIHCVATICLAAHTHTHTHTHTQCCDVSVKLHLRDKHTKRQTQKENGYVFLSVCYFGGVKLLRVEHRMPQLVVAKPTTKTDCTGCSIKMTPAVFPRCT